MRKTLLHILVFWCSVSTLLAQDIAYRQLRPGQESPLSEVYGRIVQDTAGYIWAGGVRGLHRFDGAQWKAYPFDEEVIRDGECIDLQLAENGILWYTNANKQLCFLPVGGDTIRSPFLTTDWQQASIPYLALQGELVHFALRGEDQRIQQYYSLYTDGTVKELLVAEDPYQLGNLRFDSQDQLYYLRLKDKTGELRMVNGRSDSLLKSFSGRKLYSLEISQPVLGNDALFVVQNKSPSSISYLQDGEINLINDWSKGDQTECYEVFSDHQGNYWVTTDRGFFGYDQNMLAFFDGQSLASKFIIHNVFQDRDGAYWLGTKRNGVLYVPNIASLSFMTDNSELSSDQITHLEAGPDNSFFAGAADGSIYLFQDDTLIHKLKTGVRVGQNDYVDYLYFDGEILHFDIHNQQKYEAIVANSTIQIIDTVNNFSHAYSVYRDKSTDRRYYGTNTGIWLNGISQQNIRGKKVSVIQPDHFNRQIWVGGNYGLGRIIDRQFPQDQQKIELLPFPFFVTDILQTPDSNLWVATAGQGIFVLKNDDLIIHWEKENGLSSDNCRQLALDASNNVWVATDKGVTKINYSTQTTTLIGEQQGLLNPLVHSLHLDERNLWAGTEEGLYRIPLSEINRELSALPKPIIDQFKSKEEDLQLHSGQDLNYWQNNLSIGFRSLSFLNQKNLAYRYRLVGLDNEWIEVSAAINFVNFPALTPGDYQFEVQAFRQDSDQISEYKLFSFHILCPFWQMPWFIIVTLLGIIGTSVYISERVRKTRFRTMLKQQNYERRIANLRTRALRLQMNPHFVYNTMNAVFLAQMDKDRKSSLRIINRYGQLFRSVFEHAERETIELAEEIDFLSVYLEMEELRFGDRIEVQFKPGEDLRTSKVQIPPMLIQPLIENAFKHGLFHKEGQGTLKVVLTKAGNKLSVTIEDDGVGRRYSQRLSKHRKEDRTTSSELILRERIQLINDRHNSTKDFIHFKVEDLYDSNNEARGTRAQLTIILY